MSNSQGNGTNTTCPLCGTKFNRFTRGKPKTYCSDNCRNVVKFFNALENSLNNVNFINFSSNHFKGDLFRLANNIKCKNRV